MFTDDSKRTADAAKYLDKIKPENRITVNGITVHILPISKDDSEVFFVLGKHPSIKEPENVQVVVSIPKWVVEQAMVIRNGYRPTDIRPEDMMNFLTNTIQQNNGLGNLLPQKGDEIGGVIFWNAGVKSSSSFSAVGYAPKTTDEPIIDKLASLGAKLPK